jgi:lysozyme
MKTSQPGIAFLAEHEGVATRAYQDVGGVWTIGIGHTAAAGPPKPEAGMAITRDEAYALLARDLPRYEQRVEAALGPVPQAVFDGAVSFDFNTGAITRASWAKAYRAGDREGARRKLLEWNKAGGRTIAGLVRRREAEARLIFDGSYDSEDQGWGKAKADVAAFQKQLATLGYYKGKVDGLAGPLTLAAILAYQKSHPDLVADGIAGRATRASLARDLAARAGTAAAGAATLVATVLGAVAAPADALLWAAGTGGFALIAAGGLLVLRHRRELSRLFLRNKGA